MLEQGYWIAGIVVAIAAILGLFFKIRSNAVARNQQNANFNGDNNQVTQSINHDSDGVDKN